MFGYIGLSVMVVIATVFAFRWGQDAVNAERDNRELRRELAKRERDGFELAELRTIEADTMRMWRGAALTLWGVLMVSMLVRRGQGEEDGKH